MDNSKDAVILEELKAAKGVSLRKEHGPFPASNAVRKVPTDPDESDSEISSDDDIYDHENSGDQQTALNLNKKLMSRLSAVKEKLAAHLEQCKRNQALANENIAKLSKTTSRVAVCTVGIPYFKDKQFFGAPKNADAKAKDARGELLMVNVPRVFRWTRKDRMQLVKSIRRNAANLLLDEMEQKELREKQQLAAKIKQEAALENLDPEVRACKFNKMMDWELRDLVGPLGSREFDWLKITAMDFDGRHTANECRVMWNMFLHPDINRCKSTKDEDEKLRKLVQKFGFQDWDAIAKELDTKRTGYQCFIRYKIHNKDNLFSRYSPWSKEEDQKLIERVRKLQIGDFISWGKVAAGFVGRTKQQVYFRWVYSLAPHLKKGRFTKEEDETLQAAVSKHGHNFIKIAATVMPHRTSVQLKDHYQTLTKNQLNLWSLEDDMKLADLHSKLGKDWVAIANEFPNKSRVQVRHRFSSIVRYERKGVCLEDIPRFNTSGKPSTMTTTTTTRVLSSSGENRHSSISWGKTGPKLSSVDNDLRDYFRTLHHTPSKPGRTKKWYSPKDLEEKTRKVHMFLQIMNANLVIPDHFDEDPRLTEMDKQLLVSLKQYSKISIGNACSPEELVETTRLKMFGKLTLAENEHYIPPLPFALVNKRRPTNQSSGIDYASNKSVDLLLNVEWKLVTPELVISTLGGSDEEMRFRKMSVLFLGEDEKSDKQHPSQISPVGKDNLSKPFGKSNESMVCEYHTTVDLNQPSTSRTLPNTSQQSFYNIDTSREQRGRQMPLIPPNFTTLIGFRSILLAKQMLEMKDSDTNEEEDEEMTPEGLRALELYRERLTKLFKFPVEMSEMKPPLIQGKDSIFLDEAQERLRPKRKRKDGRSFARRKKSAAMKAAETNERDSWLETDLENLSSLDDSDDDEVR